MNIILKYYRMTPFGNETWTEDECSHANVNHLKKAFAALRKSFNTGLELRWGDSTDVFYWDTFDEKDNGVITIRHYDAWNIWEESKADLNGVAKKAYARLRADR